MNEQSKGNLGCILIIITVIISLFNPVIGIVFLLLVYIFAIADHHKDNNKTDPDNPFIP